MSAERRPRRLDPVEPLDRRQIVLALVAGLALLVVLLQTKRTRFEPREATFPDGSPAAHGLGAEGLVASPELEPDRIPSAPAASSAPGSALETDASRASTAVLLVCVVRDGDPVAGAELLDGKPTASRGGSVPERGLPAQDGLGHGGEAPPGTPLFGFDPEPRRHVWTDSTGCASLVDLEPGIRPFWLRASDRSWVRFTAELEADRVRECRVVLGQAGVFGAVYDPDGQPVAGAPLVTQQRGSSGEPPLWFIEQGASLDASQHLFFLGEATSFLTTTQGGSFALELPVGAYHVRITAPDGPLLGEVDLQHDLHRDLALPGIVVRGSLTYVGSKHPQPRGPEREVLIELLDDERRPTTARAIRWENGYSFIGLRPDRYTLMTRPWPLSQGVEGVPLTLVEEVPEVVVDLRITDP